MQECSNTAMLTVTQDGIFDVTALVIVVKKITNIKHASI